MWFESGIGLIDFFCWIFFFMEKVKWIFCWNLGNIYVFFFYCYMVMWENKEFIISFKKGVEFGREIYLYIIE